MKLPILEDENEYFTQSTKKCFISRGSGIKTFDDFLARRYRDMCYFYSEWALMGMDGEDKVIRGIQRKEGDRADCYWHGWLEYMHNDKELVFDSLVRGIVSKKDYYDYFAPEINHAFTKKEVLSRVMNDKNCSFNGSIITVDKIGCGDTLNDGLIISPMRLSKFIMSANGEKVERFIAKSSGGD